VPKRAVVNTQVLNSPSLDIFSLFFLFFLFFFLFFLFFFACSPEDTCDGTRTTQQGMNTNIRVDLCSKLDVFFQLRSRIVFPGDWRHMVISISKKFEKKRKLK